MPKELSPGQKAAQTRKRKAAAAKAVKTTKAKGAARKAVQTRKANQLRDAATAALSAIDAGDLPLARERIETVLKLIL
jgi:hypothetical protein